MYQDIKGTTRIASRHAWTIIQIYSVLIVYFVGICHHSEALKLQDIQVPFYAVLNNPAKLLCNFVLDDDDILYSVKWYKDGYEFFRYSSINDPPITIFPLDGINVNVNRSTVKEVQLEKVTFLTKGVYRCEVSLDHPSFMTVFDDLPMNVMALPERGPKITEMHPWYNLNDVVTPNCSLYKGFPSPKIKWSVNQVEINENTCDCMKTVIFDAGKTEDGTMLYTTSSKLQFRLAESFFKDGTVSVECKAVYPKTNIILKDHVESNIKAGFHIHHFALSSKARGENFSFLSHLMILLLSLF